MKIDEKLFPYFIEAGSIKKYKAREIIYMQEDKADQLFLVLKGRVRVFYITDGKHEVTIEILEKGRIFGESSFLSNSLRPTSVEAVNEVELISCTMEDLLPSFQKSGELSLAIIQHLSQTCNHLTNLLELSCNYDRYQKVAAFLINLTQSDNEDKGILNQTIPYSHEELAFSIGLARVTVSNILKEFEGLGYIACSYRKIKVINRKALMDVIYHRKER